MDSVKVTINNEVIEVIKGTSLEEISKNYQSNHKFPIILAKVDGMYKELSETVKKDCKVEFFDLTDRGTNRLFLNGLIYCGECGKPYSGNTSRSGRSKQEYSTYRCTSYRCGCKNKDININYINYFVLDMLTNEIFSQKKL